MSDRGRGRGRDATLPAWLSNGATSNRPPGPPGPPGPPPPAFPAAPGRPNVPSPEQVADRAAATRQEIHQLTPEIEMEIEQQASQQVLKQQEEDVRKAIALHGYVQGTRAGLHQQDCCTCRDVLQYADSSK